MGYIESVDCDTTTIEGNYSVTAADNGSAVLRRTRSLEYVSGAGRPLYIEATVLPYPPLQTKPHLERG